MDSVSNFNFAFNGTDSASGQRLSNFDEPGVLDDILRTNFNSDICKSDMMDLFAPSLTTTDDILDKLIQELDKDQESESADDSSSGQNASWFDNSVCPDSFDSNSISPFLANSYETHSDQKVCDILTANELCCALEAHRLDQTSANHSSANSRSFDTVQYVKSLSPTCVKADQQQPNVLPITFCVDPTLVVPPLAETVEIECTQEHSYCTNSQQCGNIELSDVKRLMQASKESSLSPLNKSDGRRISPSSSNNSVRNTHSTVPDSFFPGKFSRVRCDSKKSCDSQLSYNTTYTGLNPVLNREKLCDNGYQERYTEGGDDIVDLISQPFANGFTDRRNSGTWFKRGSKRRYKHQYMLPFSYNDIRSDEKYPLLLLSDEEKLLCEKEGLKLPTKFPLTKQEERELRRVRRKIRNKLSAQESRRKKNEYITSLEDRVGACDNENQALRRQIEALSSSNNSLAEQLKRLQSTVGNESSKQSSYVLLLSFALLVAPNNNLLWKQSKQEQNQIGLGHNEESNLPVGGNSNSVENTQGNSQQKSAFSSDTHTLLPHVHDMAFGPHDPGRLGRNVHIAAVDVDERSLYMVNSGDGGGGGGGKGGGVKRYSPLPHDFIKVKQQKMDKTRSDGYVVEKNRADLVSVKKSGAKIVKEEVVSGMFSRNKIKPNAAGSVGGIDFSRLVKNQALDFVPLKNQGSKGSLVAVVSNVNHMALYDDLNKIGKVNGSSATGATATVVWDANRQLVRTQEF